jgi:murein DD-endopeptidase MepM/ murein hydrolase activator NlpD
MAFSCTSSKSIFSKKTPHEKYADKMDDAPWKRTPAGKQWLEASKLALENTQNISLPYKQLGYFNNDKARAIGLDFQAKKGERIHFNLNKSQPETVIYADIYKQENDGTEHLYDADFSVSEFNVDIETSGRYILRLQPELSKIVNYTITVTSGPSLAFPVAGTKAKAGSFWGANRDGGKRKHEGIDIFAPKHTNAIAATDGIITNVSEGGIGGKVVWLRPIGKNISLYYAHLDAQMVQPGQSVKKDDILGLVGNTGNAKNTPSHLHFGIYTSSGPVDPWPYVNQAITSPAPVPEKKLTHFIKLLKPQKTDRTNELIKANTILVPLAVSAKYYIAELPDGQLMQVPFTNVQITNQPIGKSTSTAHNENRSNKKIPAAIL